ncbi:MAG: hypothetical protein E6G31_05790 [Actinobacteria bacterium]|nr:MAG: hypothetical protein E6G31_05790 [Actinomycetota bacterium]
MSAEISSRWARARASISSARPCARPLPSSATTERDRAPWRSFASEFGLLYQVVDDVLDGDGLVAELGSGRAHGLADEIEARARAHLDEISADTSLLDELLLGLKRRAAAS